MIQNKPICALTSEERLRNLYLFFYLFLSFGISQKATLKKLDKYFQTSLTAWNIPGMSIAIVKDDSLVFAKGYGVRDIDHKRSC